MKTLCLVHKVYNATKGSTMILTIPFEDILDKTLKEWIDWNMDYNKAIDAISKGSYSKLHIKYIDNGMINKTYYVRKGSESRYPSLV